MLCVQLLGQVRAVRDGEVISRFRTRKAEALLAYLAHFRARPHRREELLELFWPDATPEAGRRSLSVELSSLRSQLEDPDEPGGALFEADRFTVALASERVTTDVAALEAALKRADQAPPASTAQILGLEDAVKLYTGPFLAGHADPWVLLEQQRLAGLFARAVDRLTGALVAGGQAGRALELARRALAVEPRHESLHGDLMRSLAAFGDPGAALRHFGTLEVLEGSDGELLLDGSLAALAEELRASHPTPPPTATAGEPPPAGLATGVYPLLLVDGDGDPGRVAAAVQASGGRRLHALPQGGVFTFARAGEALQCAVELQSAAAPGALRIALHLAELDATGAVPDAAERLLLAAHSGQVVCAETAAVLLRRDLGSGIWLKDLGLYRLAEQAAPERVFQVEWAALPTREFPPLRAAAGHSHRLPLPLTRFLGREAELSEIEDLLLGGEARLVTVLGPGGTGKTRLCLETARRLVDALQGAVWFVPLADVADGGRVPTAVRVGLQQPELPGADPLDQIAELLGTRPALLVLDNFEQLAESGAPVVEELLQRAPRLTCLVSSRRSLGVAGEREYRLAPLPTPDPPYEVERLLRCESVRLFIDRARAVRPDFHLNPANAADLAELCARLEGLPLAIELAASRVSLLSPAEMLGRFGEALDLLSTRQRSVPERHRTLRAAIAWSYDLLPAALRRFCAEMSVFLGGWTVEAAEAVTAVPSALDQLDALRECSLVTATDGEPVRFRMLDTIRAFAAERLEEPAAARQRHFAHFLALASEGQAALERGDEAAWLDRLEAERENFRAAFDSALEHEPEGALRLAGALWRYWLVRGHWAEAEQLLGEALARTAGAPPGLRARALGWAGHVAYRRGHYDHAAEQLLASLEMCRLIGDQVGSGNALNELGKVAWAQGGHARARRWYEQSLAIREQQGNAWAIAATLSNLGVAAWALGDHDAAYQRFGRPSSCGASWATAAAPRARCAT
ncbi:MAG: tetratricopeptide repeat protein [Armatimonadetes bacterium]|nr:tetratricopeptide repeat protein [Armatimonadota bacterium]